MEGWNLASPRLISISPQEQPEERGNGTEQEVHSEPGPAPPGPRLCLCLDQSRKQNSILALSPNLRSWESCGLT